MLSFLLAMSCSLFQGEASNKVRRSCMHNKMSLTMSHPYLVKVSNYPKRSYRAITFAFIVLVRGELMLMVSDMAQSTASLSRSWSHRSCPGCSQGSSVGLLIGKRMAKGGLRSGLSSKGGKGDFDWSHGPKVSLFALSSRHLATAESFTAAPVL